MQQETRRANRTPFLCLYAVVRFEHHQKNVCKHVTQHYVQQPAVFLCFQRDHFLLVLFLDNINPCQKKVESNLISRETAYRQVVVSQSGGRLS